MSDAKDKTVLVIDDEPDVRFYLQTVLEDAGFEVLVASNGKQALDQVTKKKPDVISLDLVMPKMTGLKFFKYTQKNKERDDIPFVIVTAHSKDNLGQKDYEAIKSEKVKCDMFFLEKPVKPTEYVNTIRKAVGLAPSDDLHDDRDVLLTDLQNKLKTASKKNIQKALDLLQD